MERERVFELGKLNEERERDRNKDCIVTHKHGILRTVDVVLPIQLKSYYVRISRRISRKHSLDGQVTMTVVLKYYTRRDHIQYYTNQPESVLQSSTSLLVTKYLQRSERG